MTTVEKILKLIADSGISKKDFAFKIGVTPSTISEWAASRQSPMPHITKIADFFDVSVDYLLGRAEKVHPANEVPLGDFITMPIIGSISAGYDGEAVEEELGHTSILGQSLHGYAPAECFLLKVKGDSMYPDFHNKDLVLVHRQESVDSGNVAVILYNGDEATLKKVIYKAGQDWMELIPRNPEYQPKRIEGSDLQDCRVLGKILGIVWREA